jgi:hypothetical protein
MLISGNKNAGTTCRNNVGMKSKKKIKLDLNIQNVKKLKRKLTKTTA